MADAPLDPDTLLSGQGFHPHRVGQIVIAHVNTFFIGISDMVDVRVRAYRQDREGNKFASAWSEYFRIDLSEDQE